MSLPGETCNTVGSDQHLLKRCLVCGGHLWILIQEGRCSVVLRSTCHCRAPRVQFEVVTPDGVRQGVITTYICG